MFYVSIRYLLLAYKLGFKSVRSAQSMENRQKMNKFAGFGEAKRESNE